MGSILKSLPARFFGLPARDRRLLVGAWVVLVAARLGLWLLPFGVARRLALGASVTLAGVATFPPERVSWALAGASRFVPQAWCLPRALAAESLLKRMRH